MPFVFSTFFEWWYDSGTPEVRMRYAQHFGFGAQLSINLEMKVAHHGGVTRKSIQDIGSLALT